jgi:hypothetical protein
MNAKTENFKELQGKNELLNQLGQAARQAFDLKKGKAANLVNQEKDTKEALS